MPVPGIVALLPYSSAIYLPSTRAGLSLGDSLDHLVPEKLRSHPVHDTQSLNDPRLRPQIFVAGYDLIEIPMLDPEGVDTSMTARVLEETGISATTSLVCPPWCVPRWFGGTSVLSLFAFVLS